MGLRVPGSRSRVSGFWFLVYGLRVRAERGGFVVKGSGVMVSANDDTRAAVGVVAAAVMLSHTMYLSISSRKSTPR